MEKDPIIVLENVGHIYESDEVDVVSLKNISLEIYRGEFLAVIGENGSGKSTFAKLLNALVMPTSGKVTVFGCDITDETKLFDIRSRVGMVFQNPDNQMIASIIEDDIAFGPENLGIARDEIRKRVDWALAAVGMTDYAKATPFKLSGGQKQRISIAAILAMKPDVLVLDESTAMLDPKGRKEVLEVARKLNKEEGITVVHITHHLEETLFADRVFAISKGEAVYIGAPMELYSNTELMDRYSFQRPIPVFIATELIKRGISIPENIESIETLAEAICRLS